VTKHCINSNPSAKYTWVYKYDLSRQCEPNSGVSLTEMAQALSPIKILAQEKRRDGVPRITMCRAQTGWANVYQIQLSDKDKALKLGFRQWDFPEIRP